jgi:hypothetical protein
VLTCLGEWYHDVECIWERKHMARQEARVQLGTHRGPMRPVLIAFKGTPEMA